MSVDMALFFLVLLPISLLIWMAVLLIGVAVYRYFVEGEL
jgi:hypothetical protein